MTKLFKPVALLILTAFWLTSVLSAQNSGTASDDTTLFHAKAHLVLVDVFARDPMSGLPLKTLKREDFRIFDNKQQMPLTSFDGGASYDTHPVALWLIVICNEGNKGPQGELASGWFIGKEKLFRGALDDLNKYDRVGVGHWCDNGDAQLDLSPTEDRDKAISTLAQVLTPISFAPSSSDLRKGELALQRLVRLIIAETRQDSAQPLPVLLFLHTDYTGMPVNELDLVVNDLLETRGIAFGVKDAAAKNYTQHRFFREQGSVLHYMAKETGGEYFSVSPDAYSDTLRNILLQLHFRYELGFKPPQLDSKKHKLKVEFVGAAREKYKAVRLRFRLEYIPKPE